MSTSNCFPEAVGILAVECYFPAQYVCQEKLEAFDQVSKGKYTIGLGQTKMGFCVDYEDINSICLTVLNNLMEKNNVTLEQVGRIDVGTETIIDKSKSVKSTLMSLFKDSENADVEGVDNINACFGGTAALFNAINWIESSSWDGRYAIAVCGDIAIYAKGNARPTGGAGAVALLVGPNAPLVFERGLRSSHISHAYDFYKPKMDCEYPLVDGKLSINCYLNALDKCYNLYKKKFQKVNKKSEINNNVKGATLNGGTHQNGSSGELDFDLNKASAFVFHSPYCKLVRKSFARLLWNDFLDNSASLSDDIKQRLEKFKGLTEEETYADKSLETELMKLSEELFKEKTQSSLLFSTLIGNMYTPSLYGCLISHLVTAPFKSLDKSRIVLFSYGSGFAATMYSIVVNEANNNDQFSLKKIIDNLTEKRNLLDDRVDVDPVLFDKYLNHRQSNHKKAPFEPHACVEALFPGTWYLTSIDDHYRRKYARKPTTEKFDRDVATERLNFVLGHF